MPLNWWILKSRYESIQNIKTFVFPSIFHKLKCKIQDLFLCREKAFISNVAHKCYVSEHCCQDNLSTSQVWHIKMLIKQHDYWTGVHQTGHTIIFSFITQRNATDGTTLEGGNYWRAGGNVHQSCCLQIKSSFQHPKLSQIVCLREFGWLHNCRPCVLTPARTFTSGLFGCKIVFNSNSHSGCKIWFALPKHFCTNCQKPSQGRSSVRGLVLPAVAYH